MNLIHDTQFVIAVLFLSCMTYIEGSFSTSSYSAVQFNQTFKFVDWKLKEGITNYMLPQAQNALLQVHTTFMLNIHKHHSVADYLNFNPGKKFSLI